VTTIYHVPAPTPATARPRLADGADVPVRGPLPTPALASAALASALPARIVEGGPGSAPFGRSARRAVPSPRNAKDTPRMMVAMVKDAMSDDVVRRAALSITESVPPDPRTGLPNRRDFDALADATYKWIVQNIAYVRDPQGVELLQAPGVLLGGRAGDCDDHAMLVAALLAVLGVSTRFRIVGTQPHVPSHVFAEYWSDRDGAWLTLDTTAAERVGFLHSATWRYNRVVPITIKASTLSLADVPMATKYSSPPALYTGGTVVPTTTRTIGRSKYGSPPVRGYEGDLIALRNSAAALRNRPPSSLRARPAPQAELSGWLDSAWDKFIKPVVHVVAAAGSVIPVVGPALQAGALGITAADAAISAQRQAERAAAASGANSTPANPGQSSGGSSPAYNPLSGLTAAQMAVYARLSAEEKAALAGASAGQIIEYLAAVEAASQSGGSGGGDFERDAPETEKVGFFEQKMDLFGTEVPMVAVLGGGALLVYLLVSKRK